MDSNYSLPLNVALITLQVFIIFLTILAKQHLLKSSSRGLASLKEYL